MTDISPAPPEDEGGFIIRGWHVLVAMIVFFGIIAAVNAVMMSHALRSFPGEEQKKSYMQGLQYNKVLEAQAAQAALGWRLLILDGAEQSVEIDTLRLKLVNAEDLPISDLPLEGLLRRPTTDRHDIPLDLVSRGEGVYEAALPPMAAGNWHLEIDLAASDTLPPFTAEKRLFLK